MTDKTSKAIANNVRSIKKQNNVGRCTFCGKPKCTPKIENADKPICKECLEWCLNEFGDSYD